MRYNRKIKFKEVQILALGFIVLILLGGILLSLPIASRNGKSTDFIDALFTSTSATSITGLTTLDTSTHWSLFGELVILSLIQIGSLGFVLFAIIFSLLIGRKITFKNKLIMQESLNTFSLDGIVKLVKHIILFTMSIEFFGSILLSIQFIPEYGVLRGIYYSIFHSISAYGNSGFDLFGDSLISYNSNFLVLIVISLIVIVSSLGFSVWSDIYSIKKIKRFSVHSKIVLSTTLILVFGGTVLFLLFEYNNPNSIGNMAFFDKLLNSYFSSVSQRTVGYLSLDIKNMTVASKVLTIILMFIGGSPGSTAGGIKTVTIALLVFMVCSVIKGREEVEAFGRKFSKNLVYKAFTLFFLAIILILISTIILSITEPNVPYITLIFEAVSALGTGGVSLGLTPNLSVIGKIVIMILMYTGRVGSLTILLALRNKSNKIGYSYPEGKVLIG